MKINKGSLFIILLVFVLFPALTFASYPIYHYPHVTPLERMASNGEYIIYVEKEGKWQEVGSLSYDMYFREREISLDQYISTGNKVKVRIVQKGGGAAHIDSVLLGGEPPVEARDIENGLQKLSKSDFDVIDAFNKGIEVTFGEGLKNTTLKLTARVEDTIIKGVPFVFPLESMCIEMNTNAHFYNYKLNSIRGGIHLDGKIDEISNSRHFFRAYTRSVTGHPSGFTYGWVWNDDENLYVTIDFTGDNTIDGDKDYAKVYVNTGKEVKEFKVSVPEQKWGVPGFTYTGNVPYQHKVYEFKIPLSEIISEDITKQDKLLLAFSAYGTDGGACCFADGSCAIDPSPGGFQCGNSEGSYQGDGTSCDPNPCAAAIPTMNQWGIIIFVVLLGLSAALYMRRRTRKSN